MTARRASIAATLAASALRGAVRLARDARGGGAAEFALVLPLYLVLLFTLIDAGRYGWELNRAEKATMMGARYAVVTDMAASGIAGYSFAVDDLVPAGNAVPVANFEEAVCTSASCSCEGGDVCDDVAIDATAFANIVARMKAIYPLVEDGNVSVRYRNVGLGFAGNPYGSDVSPMVTVELSDLAFQPLTTLAFGVTVPMPGFKTSLTGEDVSGSASN